MHQVVRDDVLHETIDQLGKASDYRARVESIDTFNASSRMKVKGIAMSQFAAVRLSAAERGLAPPQEHIRFADGFVWDNRNPANRIAFGTFCDLARRERADLGARGFYATPGVDFNRETGQGIPFFYFTTGAAVSDVTIDRFTDEMTVDRVDLLMDVGRIINPGIDYGQIIGGFVQGMGWCTNEELVYDAKRRLLATSPTTYKISNINDIPSVFNVSTIDNPKHGINLCRSKAVGEPPLMLGISVWLAAKDAIWRLNKVVSVRLPLPATAEANLRCLISRNHLIQKPKLTSDKSISVESQSKS